MAAAPSADVAVRDLVAADRAAWQPLWGVYLEHYRQALAPDVTEATWQRLIDATDPGMGGLVAVSPERQIVGVAHYVLGPSTWSRRDDAYLEDLVVDPGWRGRGVGHALIAALVARGQSSDWRRVHWLTDAGNDRARRLYDDVGTLTPYVQYEIELDRS